MSKVNIESGIDIPEYIRTRESKYPFDEMAVGDSFLMDVKSKAYTVRARAKKWTKITGHAYEVRDVEGGVRVWRTA